MGDREHGFINARLRLQRKVVVGFWQDQRIIIEISNWMRSAIGIVEGSSLKVVRFADNMREVAVTEGDKIEAQFRLGWSINSFAMGDLEAAMKSVTSDEIESTYSEVCNKYLVSTNNTDAVKGQIHIELAMRQICEENGFWCCCDML